MSLSDWHLAVKLADQPLAPKSILQLPETELGEYSLGGYSISFLKQLIAGKLQESVPDPELIGESLWTGDGLLISSLLREDTYGVRRVNERLWDLLHHNVNTPGECRWVNRNTVSIIKLLVAFQSCIIPNYFLKKYLNSDIVESFLLLEEEPVRKGTPYGM